MTAIKNKQFAYVARAYMRARDIAVRQCKALERAFGATMADGTKLGEMHIDDVLPMHIEQAASVLLPTACNATKNRWVIIPCQAVLNFAAENKLRDRVSIRRLKVPHAKNRRPAPGALTALIDATSGHQRAFLVILAFQGWRVTEAVGLEPAGIDYDAGTLRLWVGKARREKTMVMHERTKAELRQMAPFTPARFFPWSSRFEIYEWLNPLCAQLGIVFTPHMARHDYASRLQEQAHATEIDIRDLGSWCSTRSVRRYIHPTQEHQRQMAARLDLI